MSFSKSWNSQYESGNHLSIWPWSDLVSFVYRYSNVRGGKKIRILELGCGAGANVNFFKTLNCCYHGLDGSEFIIGQLIKEHGDENTFFKVGDFTKSFEFEGKFDLIVDRASTIHNSRTNIDKTLKLIKNSLDKDGVFIGIDWFSTSHSEFKRGEPTEDPYTRTNYKSGCFADVGNVHYFSEDAMKDALRCFSILLLQHKKVENIIGDEKFKLAAWNFVCRRNL